MIWVHALNVNKLNWKIYFDGLYTIFFFFSGQINYYPIEISEDFPLGDVMLAL